MLRQITEFFRLWPLRLCGCGARSHSGSHRTSRSGSARCTRPARVRRVSRLFVIIIIVDDEKMVSAPQLRAPTFQEAWLRRRSSHHVYYVDDGRPLRRAASDHRGLQTVALRLCNCGARSGSGSSCSGGGSARCTRPARVRRVPRLFVKHFFGRSLSASRCSNAVAIYVRGSGCSKEFLVSM